MTRLCITLLGGISVQLAAGTVLTVPGSKAQALAALYQGDLLAGSALSPQRPPGAPPSASSARTRSSRDSAPTPPAVAGGERKMLSVARALALDPELPLLDEPFERLAPAVVPLVADGIAEITRVGHSILLAESNIHHVPDHATRLYVIERGEVIFAGPPDDAWRDAVLRIVGATA